MPTFAPEPTAEPPTPTLGELASDRNALIAIYNAANGANWINSDNWLTDKPVSEWYGVAVNHVERVIGLHLDGNGLSGAIPPEIGDLAYLQWIDLQRNQLSGEIPPELGGLSLLEELRLSENRLSGAIPPELGGLPRLAELRLSGNSLAGCLPKNLLKALENEELTRLGRPPICEPFSPSPDRDSLTAFYNATGGANWTTQDNWLSEYPIGKWSGVETNGDGRVVSLHLYENGLTGAIPAEIGDFAYLEWLDLPNNQLSGEMPPEIGGLANLVGLSIAQNQLTGNMPTSLGGLTNLTHLDLSQNQLVGEIPAEIGSLANLSELRLEGNRLSGNMPTALGGLTNLRWLDLSQNQLVGGIPAGIGSLANLGWLDLSQNRLVGGIPAGIGGIAYLEWLDVSQNQLNGGIPSELGDLAYLRDLRLSGNELDGCLPQELLNALESVELAKLALPLCEPTSADRDALTALYNATGGANWTRGDNWLSEYPIGKWSGVEVNDRGRLASLRLNENGLSGEIPPEIGELAHLRGLDLSGNQLTGEIPRELGELAYLEWLKLSGNRLAGCLPKNLLNALGTDELANLEFPPLCEPLSPSPDRDALTALYNAAHGAGWINSDYWLSEYPIDWWRGVNTEEWDNGRVVVVGLELPANGLSGEIPPEIGELAHLHELRLGENWLSGEIPPEIGELAHLRELDLSRNRLSGEIPPELGSIPHLNELRLSGNQLTGCVPESLRQALRDDISELGLPFCQP